MAVVTSFSPEADFWEFNPQLLLEPSLKAFYNKGKGRKETSAVMWWVAFCYDMDKDNTWRTQLQEDKHRFVGEELGLGPNVYEKRRKELDPLIAAYCKFTDSPAKRQLRMLERKMEEKTAFMDKTPYDDSSYEVLDKMMASDDKLYALLAKVSKQLSEETGEGTGKGGSAPSLSDNGEI